MTTAVPRTVLIDNLPLQVRPGRMLDFVSTSAALLDPYVCRQLARRAAVRLRLPIDIATMPSKAVVRIFRIQSIWPSKRCKMGIEMKIQSNTVATMCSIT